MRAFCAIPARGGSKRLPGKNIKSMAGKPMIAYSIEAAHESGLFETVYLCTDDEEIAEVARKHGAEVPYLMPPELCVDDQPSHAPLTHLAKWLQSQGDPVDTMVCLQPTSPTRSAHDIREGMRIFEDDNRDFVASVTPIDAHYFHWAIQEQEGNQWEMYFKDKYMVERIYLPIVYRPNGSIKIAKLEKLWERGNFFGKNLGVVETPEERSVHVATDLEFKLCELLIKERSMAGSSA